jgi:hypothetical protein
VTDGPERPGDRPPPPPPPDLLPPPGSVPTRRIGGIATASTVLVALTALFGLAYAVMNALAVDDARAYLDGVTTEDEFISAYGGALTVQLLQTLSQVAAGVLSVLLMFRITSNHRDLGRDSFWGPAWAVAGWFVPPLILYVIPFLVLRQMWKASDPGPDWRSSRVPPVVGIWFVLYGIAPLAVVAAQGFGGMGGVGAGTDSVAELVVDQQSAIWGAGVLGVLGAGAWIVLVRAITERHTALTAERPSSGGAS